MHSAHIKRRVFITGAAKRIGACLAESLAADGCDVAVHYGTSRKEAQDLVNDLRQKYDGVFCAVHADLTEEEALSYAFAAASDKLGGVDCVIANASYFSPDRVDKPCGKTYRAAMETNVFSTLRLARLLSRQPCARTDVVVISDYISETYSAEFFSYGASRAALDYAVKSMALHYAPDMRVNMVALGNVMPTPTQRASHFAQLCENSPLRIATPTEDVVNAVRYLLQSHSLTGDTLFLDAGKRLVRASYIG